ncbi:universal stress protein [Hymenobacter aquaticus]|uniref:Universal stress protein n=1 Tax=Hymenobacter aquaticus TaxID=1867101 RepID=A0A4Z0Q2G5_9BACT|nr:universal stress protein [Hymenobacter aquaticus]TGE23885.1 universal stress protein [Hymenobacter aquaticus]
MSSLTIIAFAGFYEGARQAVRYADTLAQALQTSLVLLHVNRASMFDPYEMLGEEFRQDELRRQTETAAALYRQAEGLTTPATVEITTDLLPVVAQDLAKRHHPVLFVLGQPEPGGAGASVEADCADLLRTLQYPVLVVPRGAAVQEPPRRFLIAADREPFLLGPNARPLRQLLATLGTAVVVAHVSGTTADDAGCGAALRAVQTSGLVEGITTPELRGYVHHHSDAGLLRAAQDTQADMVIVLARERSYLGELFHRSVTARLLAQSPVPVLVLPTATEVKPGGPGSRKTAAVH